jgi:glutathione synthase/RimK-type ligase-like ATP-grasp enzyme
MIGIISNKFDVHANYIVEKLKSRNILFQRIKTEDFYTSNFSIKLSSDNKDNAHLFPKIYDKFAELSLIKAFWFRRPFLPKISSDLDEKSAKFVQEETTKTIDGLWRLFQSQLWVNNPDANKIADNKLYQLHLAKTLGFEIPKTLITISPHEALQFFSDCNDKIVVKAISKSWIENKNKISVIRTNLINQENKKKINAVQNCPTLFQELVEKSSELRVTVIGKKIFGCQIHSQENEATQIDYKRDINSLRHNRFVLPDHLARKCLKMMTSLKLKYAAIDFIITPDNRFVFLELNPNGQWLWIEQKTKMPIADTLIEYLQKC